MNWVFGITGQAPGFKAELLSPEGEVSKESVDVLLNQGIPTSTCPIRVVHAGCFSDWEPGDASKFLRSLGIKQWPVGTSNRHEVLNIRTRKGLTLHVPTLVLMRAFFRPTSHVFPVAFKPSNVGLLSFIDYSGGAPRVVVDNASLAKRLLPSKHGPNQQSAINWMQMSRSAQRMVRSVYDNASRGSLKLEIPDGTFGFSFAGGRSGDDVFVHAANLHQVVTPARDTISGVEETFRFLGQEKSKQLLVHHLKAPARVDGELRLTSEEWEQIQPLLAPGAQGRKPQYTHREAFDLILHRLGRTRGWAELATPTISTEALTSKYRAWKREGRLELALAKLNELRTPPAKSSS